MQVIEVKDVAAAAFDSVIGDFDAAEFKGFFNVAARIAIPFINNLYLAQGFLPSDYFGVLRINDATFQSLDGYLAVTITPDFI